MARPISKVTANNFYTVKHYFQKLLEKRQLIEDFDQRWEAEKALKTLLNLDYKDTEANQAIALKALQTWINQYAAHQWPKFLALERQRKFKKKNRVRALELHENAYHQLKWYAKKVNLSLNVAVETLAKTALDKIEQAEWEQEQAKVK